MKPRIKKWRDLWVCAGNGGWMGGRTPQDAYYRWLRVFG